MDTLVNVGNHFHYLFIGLARLLAMVNREGRRRNLDVVRCVP